MEPVFPFHLMISIIIDHQSKPPERLFSMIDYENPIIEQHYVLLCTLPPGEAQNHLNNVS